ncbi:hypothetical protein [Streptomyces violaceusniger]|uniref:hypothetical protein n=1 Tax=Streptomyces violaceusniger TaxID=68280 RepID=UPI00138671E6
MHRDLDASRAGALRSGDDLRLGAEVGQGTPHEVSRVDAEDSADDVIPFLLACLADFKG